MVASLPFMYHLFGSLYGSPKVRRGAKDTVSHWLKQSQYLGKQSKLTADCLYGSLDLQFVAVGAPHVK